MAWLKDTYDVDPGDGDTVRMYFHWPTGYPTSTLHMHVRVNWRMSPVEYIHSYMLDDVIQALDDGKSVAQMIAERYKRLGGVVIDGNFGAMTGGGETPANLLNRYLRSVADNRKPVFGVAQPLLPAAFGSVKDILRTVQVVDAGTKYYIQRAVKDEKSTNIVHVDKVDPESNWWSANQGVFTDQEITDLKLTRKPGKWRELLSCLLPYFDNAHASDCVNVSAGGTDLERDLSRYLPRYSSLDAFRAAMNCPAGHTCYAARVEHYLVNGIFRLWISAEDWDTLKGVDAGRIDFKGYVDGIESPDNTFKVKEIGGISIANGYPDRKRDSMKLTQEYRKDERIINAWAGRFAMLAKPN